MKIYPSWRYHKTLEPKLIHSEEQEEKGWSDVPFEQKEEVKLEKAQPASEAQEEAQESEAVIDESKEEFQVLKKIKKGAR